MPKDTKSLGNNKAPACESRGFVLKKKKVRILTHLQWRYHRLAKLPPNLKKNPLRYGSSLDG